MALEAKQKKTHKVKYYKAGLYARLFSDQDLKTSESVVTQIEIAEKYVEDWNRHHGDKLENVVCYIELVIDRERFDRIQESREKKRTAQNRKIHPFVQKTVCVGCGRNLRYRFEIALYFHSHQRYSNASRGWRVGKTLCEKGECDVPGIACTVYDTGKAMKGWVAAKAGVGTLRGLSEIRFW